MHSATGRTGTPGECGGGRRPAVMSRLGWQPRHQRAGYAMAVAGTAALTLALLPFRDDITPLSKGFGFLVVVAIAAFVGGLGPGIVASIGGFLSFNYFFLPPYGTFLIARAEYVVVLFVFLGLSVLISGLLARATERAQAAEAREAELRMLQELSGDLVVRGPGVETYEAMLARLTEIFGFDAAALFVIEVKEFRGLREEISVGAEPSELRPDWDPASTERPPERLPLSVGGRNLGLIVLRGDRPPLMPPESRVLRAFCDQLALVLERDRLLHTATEAEVYRQTESVRRSLLAAVSHDLRSPLAAIKASVTDLLADDAPASEEYRRDALDTINAESDRLNALIANLLDMSRIESGVLKARVERVDLEEILEGCADRVRRQSPGVEVRLRTASDAASVDADPVFLDRVVTNLLENAASAAAKSGNRSVEVDTRRQGDETQVRIVDHGSGVPPAAREQLFYPFYDLNERNPRLGQGLGLAISKGFLSLMNGDVWIEDTPGGGATFAFMLPAARGG